MTSKNPAPESRLIDCEAGRRLGCRSFCCRLLVRLQPGERDPGFPDRPEKSCVDKDRVTGLCAYFEPASGRCQVWERRPAICRGYSCNEDPLLQVVLRDGFDSLVRLVRAPRFEGTPVRIPTLEDPES